MPRSSANSSMWTRSCRTLLRSRQPSLFRCVPGVTSSRPLPALVAVDSPSRGATLAQVCQTYSDRIRYLTPYQMLPGGRSRRTRTRRQRLGRPIRDLEGSRHYGSGYTGGENRAGGGPVLIYVLDANALIGFLGGQPGLNAAIRAIISDPGPGNQLAIPTIALVEAWDLARKKRRGFDDFSLVARGIEVSRDTRPRPEFAGYQTPPRPMAGLARHDYLGYGFGLGGAAWARNGHPDHQRIVNSGTTKH